MDEATSKDQVDASASLTEMAEVVRRRPRRSPVLDPGQYRTATVLGVFLLAFGICGMLGIIVAFQFLPTVDPEKTGQIPTAVAVAVVFGLVAMGVLFILGHFGLRLALRIPRSRVGRDEFDRAQGRYGPYKTIDALAMAYYAHDCAARARNTTGRERRKLLRMCAQYMFCPRCVQWAAKTYPTRKVAMKQETHEDVDELLFALGIYEGGNPVANAWSHLYYFVLRAPSELVADIERLATMWCCAVYKVYQVERDTAVATSHWKSAQPILAEIVSMVEKLERSIVGPNRRPSVVFAYREWFVVAIVIAVAWVILGVIAYQWPSALPSTLVTAVIGTGALVLAAWNLYSGRVRAERPIAAEKAAASDA